MFKKLMLLLGCVTLLTLVACDEEIYEPEPIIENSDPIEEEPEVIEEELVELEFSIEIISDDELVDLENYTEINYALARDVDSTDGLNLLFNFNKPVTDFLLIDVVVLEDDSLAMTNLLYAVGDLDPDTPLVITNYLGSETQPSSGFYFSGSGAEGGWFTFEQDARDEEKIIWSPFGWSHDYDLFVVESEPDVGESEDVDMPVEIIHPIVGTWDDLWEDTEDPAYADAQLTFSPDGTGFIVNFGQRDVEFVWSIENDILTMVYLPNELWPSEETSSYRYRIDGDILIKTLLSIIDGEISEVQDFYFARIE